MVNYYKPWASKASPGTKEYQATLARVEARWEELMRGQRFNDFFDPDTPIWRKDTILWRIEHREVANLSHQIQSCDRRFRKSKP